MSNKQKGGPRKQSKREMPTKVRRCQIQQERKCHALAKSWHIIGQDLIENRLSTFADDTDDCLNTENRLLLATYYRA